jgi:hypothetical protein
VSAPAAVFGKGRALAPRPKNKEFSIEMSVVQLDGLHTSIWKNCEEQRDTVFEQHTPNRKAPSRLLIK